MNALLNLLIRLYLPICVSVLLGAALSFGLSRPKLQRKIGADLHHYFPIYLGKFLFLVGVPLGVVNFIRKADLSGAIWLSPLVAWGAILLGLFCSWLWLRIDPDRWSIPTRGSFTLVSIVGNTGYIGFPVILLLPQLGPDYFGWALLYDMLGTFFGAYGLGVIIASHTKLQAQRANQQTLPPPPALQLDNHSLFDNHHYLDPLLFPPVTRTTLQTLRDITLEVLKNPTLPAFGLGLALRSVVFPDWLDFSLNGIAWSMIMLSLVLMGIRLQQLDSWRSLRSSFAAVGIKMFLVPLFIAMLLTVVGLDGPPRLVLVLQAAMPSAFATLLLAEGYNLDRNLIVTALGVSSLGLLVMLPFWLWGFATW